MLNRRRLRRAHARPVNTQPEFTMQEDKVLYVYIWQRLQAWLVIVYQLFFYMKKR